MLMIGMRYDILGDNAIGDEMQAPRAIPLSRRWSLDQVMALGHSSHSFL